VSRQGGKASEPQLISEEWAASRLPRREPGAHKWSVGGVVVVAGSPQFAGAAALCCAAAGRSGAGIVSAALPRSIVPVVVGLVPEVTAVILPEGESPSVARRAAEAIAERLERSKAIVVGPGLGDDEATAALLNALFGFSATRGAIGFGSVAGSNMDEHGGAIASGGKPAVVDADALNWLAKQASWWERLPRERLVLTPHAGEIARLLETEVANVLADPVGTARECAARWEQTVVLKGAPTIIAEPNGELMATETTPALATAGSGDVMSGSIGAFLAQGLAPLDAAALAAFVGERAAERLSRRLGTLGVVAGDLPAAIAEELGALEHA
jgi:NAD(P)H-hydrate epimerase